MASSWTTLTSLALVVEPGRAQFDLERLCNLNLLRVCLKDDTSETLYPDDDPISTLSPEQRKALTSAFVQDLRSTLRSAQSLPITTLSLGTYLDYVGGVLSSHLLFDLLPPSLQHLASPFDLLNWNGVNYSEFIKAYRNGRFPRFQRLTIFPADYEGLWHYRNREMRASHSLREPGIIVDLSHHHEGGGTPWFNLEPYHVHSEEEEEASSDSESNEDSDDYDDFDEGPEEWSSDNEHL